MAQSERLLAIGQISGPFKAMATPLRSFRALQLCGACWRPAFKDLQRLSLKDAHFWDLPWHEIHELAEDKVGETRAGSNGI